MLTGKHILADPNVNGPINIMVNDQVPRSEAIKIIETQLNAQRLLARPGGRRHHQSARRRQTTSAMPACRFSPT